MAAHFVCQTCKKSFKTYLSLRSHEGKAHGATSGECPFCSEKFKTRHQLNYHKKIKHSGEKIQGNQVNGNSVKCGECQTFLPSVKNLCRHLNEIHKFAEIKIESFDFATKIDYEVWKNRLQLLDRFELVAHSGKVKTETEEKERLYCHRSGFYSSKSKGIKSLKSIGTNRVDFHCSCFAFVTTSKISGKISVLACLQHYGHDESINRLRMPLDIRLQIARFVSDGMTVDWILQYFQDKSKLDKSSNSNHKRIHRQDIHNVSKRLNIPLYQPAKLKRNGQTSKKRSSTVLRKSKNKQVEMADQTVRHNMADQANRYEEELVAVDSIIIEDVEFRYEDEILETRSLQVHMLRNEVIQDFREIEGMLHTEENVEVLQRLSGLMKEAKNIVLGGGVHQVHFSY